MGEGSSSSEPFESIDLMPSALKSIPDPFRPFEQDSQASQRISLNVPASDSATDYEDDYSDHESAHDFATFKSRDDDFDPEELILSQSPPKSGTRHPIHGGWGNSSPAQEHASPHMRKRFDPSPYSNARSDISETTTDLSGSSFSFLRSSNNNGDKPNWPRVVGSLESGTDPKSPLHFFAHKNSVLRRELVSNIARQKDMLEHGHPDLDKVRSMIGQDFSLLSENYMSLHEFLSRQHLETFETLNSLKKFEAKSTRLLEKIAHIKSPVHDHGSKLAQLLQHDDNLNNEITALERKIESFKEKKRVIKSEIETTASVLESEASKYVSKFKTLELQGRKAAELILQAHGVPIDQLNSIISTNNVNITFKNAYLKQKAKSPSQPVTAQTSHQSNTEIPSMSAQTHQSAPNEHGGHPASNPRVASSRNKPSVSTHYSGHQVSKPRVASPRSESSPHENPIRPASTSLPTASLATDRESHNHGHGPSPYERGFEYGSKLSVRVRKRMSEILYNIWASINDRVEHHNAVAGSTVTTVVDEDEQNNITSRLDLAPVIALLRQEAEANETQARECANESAQCHELAKVWQDANSYMVHQENKMAAYVASMLLLPPTTENAQWIMNNLHATAEKLEVMANVSVIVPTSASDEIVTFLKQALANESLAIAAAIKVAASHFNTESAKVANTLLI